MAPIWAARSPRAVVGSRVAWISHSTTSVSKRPSAISRCGAITSPCVLEPGRDRHAARGRAADVRMMGAIDHKTAVLGPVEERCDEGDVREVRPAQVGIVQDHHVPRCRPETLDDPRHREGHAAEVHRDVRGLGR